MKSKKDKSTKVFLKNTNELLTIGRNYHANRNLKKANEYYEKVVFIDNKNYEAYNLLGVLNLQIKNFQLAVHLLDRSIELKHDNAEAHYHKALALESLSYSYEALENLNQSIKIRPEFTDAYIKRGNIMLNLTNFENAIEDFDCVISLNPNKAYAYLAKGCALMGLNKNNEAIENFNKAIYIEPTMYEAYSNKGNALMEINSINEALENYDQAIKLNNNFAAAYSNRSNPLRINNKIEEALRSINTAIDLDPKFADAYYNKGTLYLEQNNINEAIDNFKMATSLDKSNAKYRYNMAIALLTNGNLDEGWQLYEYRWDLNKKEFTTPKKLKQIPSWKGKENIKGKTILITHEQGLGDFIQLCRYATDLKKMGAITIFEVPLALMSLIEFIKEIDYKVKIGEWVELNIKIDYACSIFSLPLALHTTLTNIGSADKYLHVNQLKINKWEKIIKSNNKIKVGLVWKGNPHHLNDKKRSILLPELIEYLPVNNKSIEYYSLQKDFTAEEKILMDKNKIYFNDNQIEDFSDTAALCELMDIILTVDTAVAHLAGALEKKTWLLLPYNPDWRWLLNTEITPWYKSILLFRQERRDSWNSVLASVQIKLSSFAKIKMVT